MSEQTSTPAGVTPDATPAPLDFTAARNAAGRYQAAGLSVIPAGPDKRPRVQWKPYQERIAPPAQLGRWFDRGDAWMGIVCGRVSQHREVLDFDDPDAYAAWRELVDAALLDRLPIVRTPSGGFHVHYRCEALAGNQKLAMNAPADVAIETRGEGGYVLVPPSPGYTLLAGGGPLGSICDAPLLEPEERDALHEAARSLNRWVEPAQFVSGPASATPGNGALRPGDDFSARGDPVSLLQRHGWKRVHTSGGASYWRHPRKTGQGWSATLGHCGPNVFYVFSTNAHPFTAERAYSPFAVYTLLEHDGDFRAAAKALAADGYGAPLAGPVVRVDRETGEVLIVNAAAGSSPPTNGTGEGAARDGVPPDYVSIGIVPALAGVIEETDSFALDAGGRLYVYRNGVYHPNGVEYVAKRTRELLDAWGESKKWSTHRAKETAAYIATSAPALWERPPLDRINVKNGLLDIRNPERPCLSEHSPGYLSVVQLPITYDAGATCPAWETFVSETFPADACNLAWEIPADLMLPDRSDQRAILFVGEGSNGKSTYLRGVRAFIGKRNVAGKSLHKLESDRFSVAGLFGKLANICADLPSVHLETTSMFKMITGGDTLDGEYKHLNAFQFDPFVRLIFSANHYPRSSDSSHAFFRRWVILPFERTFEGQAATPSAVLDARLAHPRELSGMLNKAIAALPQLRKRGFTVSPSMQQAWEEFRGETDPLAVWLDHATETDSDGFIPRAILRKAYADHCREAGHPAISDTAFGSAMRRLRPALPFKQRVVDGRTGVWCYLGIRLRSAGGPPNRPPGESPNDPQDGGSDSHKVHRVNRVPLNYNVNSEIVPPDEEGDRKVSAIKRNPVNPVNLVTKESAPEPVPATGESAVGDPPLSDDDLLWQWMGRVQDGEEDGYPEDVHQAAQRAGFTFDRFQSVKENATLLRVHLEQRAGEEASRG